MMDDVDEDADADEDEDEEDMDDEDDEDENMNSDGGDAMLEVAPLCWKSIDSKIFMTSAGTYARASGLNSWTRCCTARMRAAYEALV